MRSNHRKPDQKRRLILNEDNVMRAVDTEAQSRTDSRIMITTKQITARRNVTRPAHHLVRGMP